MGPVRPVRCDVAPTGPERDGAEGLTPLAPRRLPPCGATEFGDESGAGPGDGPGQNIPGFTTKDYGRNNQYGQLLNLTYLSTGTTVVNRYNNFRQVLPNSCTR